VNKTVSMTPTTALEEIVRQGFYFIIRYYDGTEIGSHSTLNNALNHAVRLKRPGFQIVQIPLR
jgi:hypothetical protein